MAERQAREQGLLFTVTAKKEICKFKEDNLPCIQGDILAMVDKHYGLSIG